LHLSNRKNMKYSALITLLFLVFTGTEKLSAQTPESELDKASDDDKITSGEYYFNAKLYRLSLMAWESLMKDYPDNPRVNYMAGKCILHLHARKEEALDYLKKIEPKIGISAKFRDKYPEDIPIDAHFLLGQAYHHNEKPDEAIAQYNTYLTKGKDLLNEEQKKEVKRWITWANNAKESLANPDKDVTIVNMGEKINTKSDEYSPVLSLDENVMYFTSRRIRPDGSNAKVIDNETGSCYEDVYIVFRNEDGTWNEPELMSFKDHELDEHEATVSTSADGIVVYIYLDREGGGDLFSSEFESGDSEFSLINLKGEINSPSWETHATLTPDGNVLFFTSNRPGGYGGLDIYRVIKLPNGEWSKAEVLPAPINTPYDEDCPFIHPSGNLLYFSSNSDQSMGEYDIFYSEILTQQPLKFSNPVALGYPVNTVDNDMFFMTNASGDRGYYSSTHSTDGFGGQDIYYIEFEKPKIGSLAILKGFIKMVDGSQIPDNLSITLNSDKIDQEQLFKPRMTDGGFVMALQPCNDYTIEYFKGDSSLKSEKFNVPCKSGYQEIYKELFIDTLFLAVNLVLKEDKEIIEDLAVEEKTNDKLNEKTEAKPAMAPVDFMQYFGYNKNVADSGNEYRNFLDAIIAQVKNGGIVKVTVEGSASRVPTSTFPSNDALAKIRAQNFKTQLLSDLKKAGVNESAIKFINVKSSVSGPAYSNDFDSNSEAYGKFQYVKAHAE